MKEYLKPTIIIEEMSTPNLLGASENDTHTVSSSKNIDFGGVDDGSHAPSSRSTVWGYEESDSPE